MLHAVVMVLYRQYDEVSYGLDQYREFRALARALASLKNEYVVDWQTPFPSSISIRHFNVDSTSRDANCSLPFRYGIHQSHAKVFTVHAWEKLNHARDRGITVFKIIKEHHFTSFYTILRLSD